MADKLTPQQEQAVNDRGGNLLVSAAAGSGKTKVLVDRLMKYLTDPVNPADLDEFLIITYTKAAASELRGKIAAKITQQIAQQPENRHLQKQMQRLFLTKISTVHGFCGDILREYAYKLDVPADFRVADENECREMRETVLEDLLDRAYEKVDEDPDFRMFVDTQGVGRNDALVPQIIEKVYDSAQCHLNPEQWLESCLIASDISDVKDVSDTVWGRYLLNDLFEYLDCQISVFEQCVHLLQRQEGLEKQTAIFQSILHQLQFLRSCKTWDEVVAKKEIDYGRLTFPRKNNPDPELSERVKAARDACKAGLKRKTQPFTDNSVQVLNDLRQTSAGVRGLVDLVRQFGRDYSAQKRSRRCLDFSDLEHKTLDLLLGKTRSGPTSAAVEIGRRYREIMVDEYQDSNGVQDAIFSALTKERQNCFLVGDVKQSIYQFRLADPGIFLDKYHHYVPAGDADPGQGRKVLLSHNFRSGPEVIEAVNAVFESCMTEKVGGLQYGAEEALREGVPHEPMPEAAVELFALEIQEDTYGEEAAFVADKIRTMLCSGALVRKEGKMKPVAPEDIVILLRSPGSVGAQFQKALESRGICCSSGGGMNLLKTQEIGTLRSFLQTIMNPRQDIPLISTLASPVFGFTADDLAVIRSKQKKGAVYDALMCSDSPKAMHFLSVLKTLRQDARMNTLTGLLKNCLTLTRLDSIYGAMPSGDAKTANIQTFYQLAADYEKGNHRDLGQFLDHLDALEEKGLIAAGSSNSGCVSIMSIHKSKGLEFPVVFLCGLSREFNRESLRAQILCDKELGLGLSIADVRNRVRYASVSKRAIAVHMASESLSEEMRVLYVAMTRARDRLIMTYAGRNLEKQLKDIALRMDFDGGNLLCRDVVCPGEWVLLEAMKRTEAGQLHALGGRPAETRLSKYPWKICVQEAPDNVSTEQVLQEEKKAIPGDCEQRLKKALNYRYPHMAATVTPSKQTATDRKGRIKDAEAAENADDSKNRDFAWRQPGFRSEEIRGKAYGNAIHAAMQYIRYENCTCSEAVKNEINRLVEEKFLTPEQGIVVNCEKIARFFETDMGVKLRSGTPHLREFKFSILDNGSRYGDGLEEEQVLLQGVVDCALLEPDGITILDFKTDKVTEETVIQRAEYYRPQVQTYAEALCRIYEMPIKGKYLYFFSLDRFISV